jgi:hypothetical protein
MDRKRRIIRTDAEVLRQGLGSFPWLDYDPVTGGFLAL